MSDHSNAQTESQKLPAVTLAGAAIAILSGISFMALLFSGASRHFFGIAMLIGWLALFSAVRPMVAREARSALWFAIALLGFFLLFVYETYAYTGKVRLFPLLIGYVGIIFSILDVLSLTKSRAGTFVTGMFGQSFDVRNLEGRSVSREVVVIAAMCLIVLVILVFGFLPATLVVVIVWMMVAGGKSLKAAILTGLGSLVFVYGLFELVLQYELYRGLIWEWYTD